MFGDLFEVVETVNIHRSLIRMLINWYQFILSSLASIPNLNSIVKIGVSRLDKEFHIIRTSSHTLSSYAIKSSSNICTSFYIN